MQLIYPHRLWADWETKSANDIKAGSYVYAEDSSPILHMYALDDDLVQVWDVGGGQPMPRDLHDYFSASQHVELAYHNTAFDRVQMITWPFMRQYHLPVERFFCTMTAARAAGLPGALDGLCKAVGLPPEYSKKDGGALIRFFCIPIKGTTRYNEPKDHPDKWQQFIDYGIADVVAMREAIKRIPNVITLPERGILAYSDTMNDRGIPVDRAMANAAMIQSARFKGDAKREAAHIIGDEFNPSSSKAIIELCKGYGIELEDTRGSTLEKLLDTAKVDELPPTIQKILTLRVRSNKASVAKYTSLLKGTNSDNRARGLVSPFGAGRTGRDAGRRFQPQNLARPVLLGKNLSMDQACQMVLDGTAMLHVDNPLQLLSDTVRGTVAAPAGKKFCGADLSAIEGRVLPWLAGEDWKTQYFRDLDAGRVKYDGYELAYAVSFGANPANVTKAQRTLGKPIELSCLGANTQVLTSNGVKAMVDISINDLLWDGTQWTAHNGLVHKGFRNTLDVDGLAVTPDHLIDTQGIWTQARELASRGCMLTQALATGLDAIQSLALSEAPKAGWPESIAHVIADHQNAKCSKPTCYGECQNSAPCVREHLRQSLGARPMQTTPTYSPTRSTVAACLVASLRALRDATTQRPPTTQPTGAVECGCIPSGTPQGGAKTKPPQGAARSSRTSLPCQVGTTRCLTWTESKQTETTNLATCDSSPPKPTTSTGVKSAPCSKSLTPCEQRSPRLEAVYDIADAGPRNRFTVLTNSGAVVVHNCGYNGGVGALMTFAVLYRIDIDEMARLAITIAEPGLLYQVGESYDWFLKNGMTYDLPEQTWVGLQYIVKAWRKQHPATVAFWKASEEAFRNAINNPGVTFPVGPHIEVTNSAGWIFVKLPSGRCLVYPHAFIMPEKDGREGRLAFWGVNAFTKQWGVIFTYGGKLVENFTQAVARDVLMWSVPAVEAAGYPVVLRVHDELLCETPDLPQYTGEEVARIMATPHRWCHDLPLNAVGESTKRFQK